MLLTLSCRARPSGVKIYIIRTATTSDTLVVVPLFKKDSLLMSLRRKISTRFSLFRKLLEKLTFYPIPQGGEPGCASLVLSTSNQIAENDATRPRVARWKGKLWNEDFFFCFLIEESNQERQPTDKELFLFKYFTVFRLIVY